MSKIIVYHGSTNVVEKPMFGYGKKNNDYGLGFYTTKDKELAKEWAVDENTDGYANIYELDLNGLNVLDLSKCNVLNWIAILLLNRKFNVKNDIASGGKEYLIKNYSLPFDNYDVIIGYRADDSYFTFADNFLNNTISVEILEKALKLGKLGIQIVLKSKKSFEQIKYIGSEKALSKIYYPLKVERSLLARNEYNLKKHSKIKPDDIYLIDIIRGGVKK